MVLISPASPAVTIMNLAATIVPWPHQGRFVVHRYRRVIYRNIAMAHRQRVLLIFTWQTVHRALMVQ